MFELRVEEGRLSEYYNHFEEFEFSSCQATQTRLMGVVALKITWKGKANPRARYYQVIHLDYSEYGFDEYLEFDCTPGVSDCDRNKDDLNYYWKRFTSVMGGSVVTIGPEIMLKLIDTAAPLAADNIDREYDNQENIDFRHFALMRIGLMRDALSESGITSDVCSANDAISAVSPRKLATCETLNYFIMRLIDHDFDAACYLSDIERNDLMTNPLTEPGIQTLIRSNLSMSSKDDDPPADGSSFPYRCTITTLGRKGYYHASFVIYLDGDYQRRNPKVTQIEIGSMIKLSDFESAIQVAQKEYITVFDVPDHLLEDFDGALIAPLSGVEPEVRPNGWLYTIYNKDNSHVNRAEYRLNDDIFGYALLTIPGQFILMTHDVDNITALDNATMYSFYAPYLSIRGRFLLDKTPVFHTLCHSTGALFEDLIEMKPQ